MSTQHIDQDPPNRRRRTRIRLLALAAAIGAIATSTIPSVASGSSTGGTTAARCTVGAKLVPKCGLLWGIYSTEIAGKHWSPSYTSLERTGGRQFDIIKRYHDFSGKGANGAFPNDKERELGRDGRILYFAWTSQIYGANRYATWSKIASGKYDASVLVPVANQVKQWGKKVFIDFDHEPDSARRANRGKAADYVAAYRHITKVFDRVGANNVVWAWVTTGWTGNAALARTMYPGDDYVDWIGWDPYNYYTCRGMPWRSPSETFGRWYHWLQDNGFDDKPYLIAEYGTVSDPKDKTAKARWYRDLPKALASYPDIRAVIQFNSNKFCDFRVHKNSDVLKAFGGAGKSSQVNAHR